MDKMMNQKEAIRAQVMELLTAGTIDQKEAGKRLAAAYVKSSASCDVTAQRAYRG